MQIMFYRAMWYQIVVKAPDYKVLEKPGWAPDNVTTWVCWVAPPCVGAGPRSAALAQGSIIGSADVMRWMPPDWHCM
jgi:hypothetical protein